MASLFGSDPELAAASSSQLSEIRDQIDPVGQWLGDLGAVGVPQVGDALGEFANAASNLTDDLTTRVGGASDLLGALASGTHEVDQSLADQLGLTPAPTPEQGQVSPGAPPVSAGTDGRGLDGASGATGAPRAPDSICTGGDPVDVATGDVLLNETDVTLPGILPLVLERRHRSSWRTGRWFGQSWLSSFDQRLLITADRVVGAFADGRVLTWTHPNGSGDRPMRPVTGATWPLRRSPDGSFTVTDPQRGLTWRFAHRADYEAGPGDQGELPLISVSDRIGHEVVFSYGAAGQPVGVTHSGGYHVRVTVTGGHVTSLALAGADGSADLPLVSYEYDADGNLAGVLNSSGQPLRFSYDRAGRLTGWTDRNDHSYRYAYDAQGRCIRGDGPRGALSGTFSYQPGITRWTDTARAVTTYEVTDSAQIAAITDPLGNVTRWEHDARGQVSTHTDPLGRITRYTYDDSGNLVAIIRPDGIRATAEYDEQCQPVLLTGPDGRVWQQEYDSRGNRVRLIAPDRSTTQFSYDENANLAGVTGPDGAVTLVDCDPAGLPLRVTAPDGTQTRCDREPSGRVTRITGPDGAVTSLAWTPEGRPTTRTFPDGTQETWHWDAEGNVTGYVSPAGTVTSYEYGPFDRLAAMRWPDGTRSEFRYDHELRLTEVLHGGLAWRYGYDTAGRLTSETDYNGATTRYAYDPAGQLTDRVNATGQEVALGYDLLGNLAERSAEGATTTFSYDPAGRLVHAQNPDAEIHIERDALGRVTAESCNGRTVRSDYDPAGRITRRVTPSGAETSWEYGQAGLPATMTSGGHRLRFGYDAAGRETRRELPGGLTLSQDWDTRGRLTVQALAQPELPGGQVLQRRAYRYRADGYPDRIEDLLTGDRALSLDPTGRVTGVTGPDWAERYAYDAAGNLTSATWPAPPPGPSSGWPDPGAQGQREVTGSVISRAGNIRYRHDRAGRVVTRQRIRISRKPDTWQYQWDADNRLTAVTTPDGSAWRYGYDPFGRRISKWRLTPDGQVSGQTVFAWDGAVLAEQTETTGGGEQITTWDYQPGTFTPLTQAERTSLRDAPQDEIDQRFYAIITDLAGTACELASSDGTLASHQQHTLWGTTQWTGPGTPLRFPGQYADPETGLHYNNQRYYDPLTASYLTPDPLGLAPAPNPHTYVPNPQTRTDPLGLQSCPAAEAVRTKVGEMRAAMTEFELGRTTYAAARVITAEGKEEMWVASAGVKGYVRSAIRGEALNIRFPAPSEVADLDHINDAEMHLWRSAQQQNAIIVAIGATRPVCTWCQLRLPDGIIVTERV